MTGTAPGRIADAVHSDEHALAFACFGGTCEVRVAGVGSLGPAPEAARAVRRQLLAWHDRFTRFESTSELSRLNADPAPSVRVSRTMGLLLRAIGAAGAASGGLVDATLLQEVRVAGYADHHDGRGIPLRDALAAAPSRRPATPRPDARWAEVRHDAYRGRVVRPPGLLLDGGGLVKGLVADELADRLAQYDRFVVNCCGDLRIGGRRGDVRPVRVESPFDGHELRRFGVADGAVATSGIGRRSWTDTEGRPAHHLLDPGTGRPAFTGVVQASALAPTALEAEWRSKAALLTGPLDGVRWLPHGGLLVLDDGASRTVAPRTPSGRTPVAGAP